MSSQRIAAFTAAICLASAPLVPTAAAASADPSGYAPAGTHEVIIESVPVPDAPAPPAPPELETEVVVAAPVVDPYRDPTMVGPTTTTVLVAPTPQPAPPPAPMRRPPPPKRGLGLMIAGFSMFGTTYLLTAWAGALTYDGHGGCSRFAHGCRERGKALMVPFVGPMIATHQSDSARETFGLFLVSGLQIAAFTMGLIGAVRYSRFKRWERGLAGIPLGKSGLAVQPMPRFDGGGLGLNYRF